MSTPATVPPSPEALGIQIARLQRQLSDTRLRNLRQRHPLPSGRLQEAIEHAAALCRRPSGLYSHDLASDALDYAEALADALTTRH